MVIQQDLLGFTLYFRKKNSKQKSLHIAKKAYQVSVLLPKFNTKWIQPSIALGSDHAQNSMQIGMRWIHRALLASPHFQELQQENISRIHIPLAIS